MDIQKMMKEARKLQAQMAAKQEELASQNFEASSGGGMVTVTVSGKMEVKGVKIDPTILKPEDVDMVQDLVMAATNEAVNKAQEAAQNLMGGMLGGMGGGIPGLF
ncbi:MAG: YbaB/EbfC family nucleoid-associated protein [Deltaproteobacteria bacterium CG11_big_fil_rev_8_21_14_0_20_47_16]|nr:MAG: YbaB/EbfC family nucleoid-associated protein [Deltaproteobacteria bacterium CG11_big_fil_rev_8_21_14_0_20_47_16]